MSKMLDELRDYARARRAPIDMHYGKEEPVVRTTLQLMTDTFIVWVADDGEEYLLNADMQVRSDEPRIFPGKFEVNVRWKNLKEWAL